MHSLNVFLVLWFLIFWSGIGCLDRNIDCDECEFCHPHYHTCRRIACNCELPKLPDPACNDGLATWYPDDVVDAKTCLNTHYASFVKMDRIIFCNQETEVQCSYGYVYFKPDEQVFHIQINNDWIGPSFVDQTEYYVSP